MKEGNTKLYNSILSFFFFFTCFYSLSWFAFVTGNEKAVLVGFKEAMNFIFAKPVTKDLHAVCIKVMSPFACSAKFTVILQEVLADM